MLPLFAPALILYLVADVLAASNRTDAIGGLTALAAIWLSLWMVRRPAAGLGGSRRVAWLALATAAWLVHHVDPTVPHLGLDLVHAWGICASAALVVDLALTVPEAIARPVKLRVMRGSAIAGASVCALLASLAVLPPFTTPLGVVLLPASFTAAPVLAAAAGSVAALWVRLLRSRRGSTPQDLAANAWALFALGPAAAMIAALLALTWLAPPWAGLAERLTLLGFAPLLVIAHLRLIDPDERVRVGATLRRLCAATLTVLLVAGAALLASSLIRTLPTLWTAVGAVLLAAVVHAPFQRLAAWLLAPAGGRLLRACDSAREDLASARDLDQVAGAVMRAMRQACGDDSATPWLYLADPPVEARLDLAGQVHLRSQPMPPEIAAQLAHRPGAPIVRGALEASIVRSPPLRPLIGTLVALDTLCVIPLMLDGEMEGALLVPRGLRRSNPTLEELDKLERLGRLLGGFLAVISARRRADVRLEHAIKQGSEAQRQIEELREALSNARSETTSARAELEALTEELAHVRGQAAQHTSASPQQAFDGTLETIERRVLDYVLTRTAGNKSEAARMLGLKRTTFLDKLRRHGVSATRPPPRDARH